MSVVIRMLPDKSGRVRIHWFVRDPAGPAETPSGSLPSKPKPTIIEGSRGRIACQPNRDSVTPSTNRSGQIEPCCHTDDPRAATCPECQATDEYKQAMEYLESLAPVDGVAT